MRDWRDGTRDMSSAWFRGLPPERKDYLRRSSRRPVETGPLTELRYRAHVPLMVPAEPGFYVYIHRDGDGRALYVGRTANPTKRTRHHSQSFWFDRIATIEWVRYEFFEAIYWAELRAIQTLEPTFNTRGLHSRPPRLSTRNRANRLAREDRRLRALHGGDGRIPHDIAHMLSRGIPLAAIFDGCVAVAA